MKKTMYFLTIITICIAFAVNIIAQDSQSIPSVKLKNLKGEVINTSEINNDGKPFVISFWATWCKPCINEMKTVNEVYEEWAEETGVKIFAVSIDDARSSKNVPAFVKGKGIKFEVLLDENSDFKRAMNVNNPPHTFLFNGKGELVWQHSGYAPGDEEELFEEIKKLVK